MTLASDLTGDLGIFFNTDEFAVSANLSGASAINVIFDLNPIDTLGVENAEVQVMAKYSDVSTLTRGSILVINGVTYYVMEIPRDEAGISIIKLSKDQT